MPLFTILLLIHLGAVALAQPVWVNMDNQSQNFEDFVEQSEGLTMNEFQLNFFENKNIEQQYLLSKVDYWAKRGLKAQVIEKEIRELHGTYVLSQNNRLILFEYLKSVSDTSSVVFRNLCALYSNDQYLKTSDSFFESSCSLNRISLKDLNPILINFDFMLVDGNRIDIKQSPYFFSTGSVHQFKFISNKYLTLELTGTADSLRKSEIGIQPWVEGTCEKLSKSRVEIPNPVKAYFSKDCYHDVSSIPTDSESFLSKNKYYFLTGLLVALVANSVSSQYSLGVTLP